MSLENTLTQLLLISKSARSKPRIELCTLFNDFGSCVFRLSILVARLNGERGFGVHCHRHAWFPNGYRENACNLVFFFLFDKQVAFTRTQNENAIKQKQFFIRYTWIITARKDQDVVHACCTIKKAGPFGYNKENSFNIAVVERLLGDCCITLKQVHIKC